MDTDDPPVRFRKQFSVDFAIGLVVELGDLLVEFHRRESRFRVNNISLAVGFGECHEPILP